MSLSLAVPLMLPNGATLPNRLAKSALSEAMGTMDNRVTQALVRLYQRWSQAIAERFESRKYFAFGDSV